MLASTFLEIGGLEIPDAGPVFLSALAVHVTAGLLGVVSGALAALSPKRAGRHPRAGTVYLLCITTIFLTAAVMTVIRFEENAHLLAIAIVAFGLAITGRWLRRRERPGWLRWHGMAMAGSYVALLTGFYVDNGAQLPVWDRLPHLAYWFLPLLVAVPVTWWALRRNGAFEPSAE